MTTIGSTFVYGINRSGTAREKSITYKMSVTTITRATNTISLIRYRKETIGIIIATI
jgi:hypothetical protein